MMQDHADPTNRTPERIHPRRYTFTMIKLVVVVTLLLCSSETRGQKFAIIGGAVSGSFTSKYLADYDEKCSVADITIFERNPVMGPVRTSDHPISDWQASRLSSLQLNDGSIVELGASVLHEGNPLVTEMIEGDSLLQKVRPFHTGKDEEPVEGGFGIFGGSKDWPIPPHEGPKWLRTLKTIVRYNIDLQKVAQVAKQSEEAFQTVSIMLNATTSDSFFQSPDEIWKKIGLNKAVHLSFATFLDALGVHVEPPSIRRLLNPFQGNIRDEFLTSINLVNYNQNVDQVNALVGLGSFAASTGELFSIRGGNYQLITSAIKQANQIREKRGCEPVRLVEKRITTVVGSLEGFQLYSGEEWLGQYDSVVLAAPIQSARVEFLIQSQNDPSILQEMPLGGLIENEDGGKVDPVHEGHRLFPHELPASAKRPYTQVTTTVISNATLQKQPILLPPESSMPRAVLFSDSGKAALYNITVISKINEYGLYKIFSNDPLPETARRELFGPGHVVEYEKVWGGPFGGATPDYQGGGASTDFLLYDGAQGLGGHTSSGALYYTNAMELSSLACVEICATGAKAVAKLAARRLGLVKANDTKGAFHDEL